MTWVILILFIALHCIVSCKENHHLKYKKFIITAPIEYKPWIHTYAVCNLQWTLFGTCVCVPKTPYEMNEPSDAIFNIIHGYMTTAQETKKYTDVQWHIRTHIYITQYNVDRHTGNNLPEYKAYLFGIDGFFVSSLFASRRFVCGTFIHIHFYVCLCVLQFLLYR